MKGVTLSRPSVASRCQHIRMLSHAAGPSKQASLVDSRPSQSSPRHPPSAAALLPASKEPLQTLHDVKSGVTITLYPSTVSLIAPQHGLTEEFHFSHVWLRDICTEENSIDKDTKQRLFHTSDIHIPAHDSPIGLLDRWVPVDQCNEGSQMLTTLFVWNSKIPAELIQSSTAFPTLRLAYSARHAVVNAFSAAFSSAPPSNNEPHISQIPLSTLLEHALPDLYASSHGDIGGRARPWTSSDLSDFPSSALPPTADQVKPSTTFDSQQACARPARLKWSSLLGETDSALDAKFALVDGLMQDGIAFVTELPTDKTGNSIEVTQEDSPSLARLAEMVRCSTSAQH